MLMAGEFAPGSRLTEMSLADRLGVSRTPVREALNTLAREGLLLHEPNRGYEVRSCSLDEVLGVYDVRSALEALACRRAAEAGLPVLLQTRMTDALGRIDALLAAGCWREDGARAWRELNAEFHDDIVTAAANTALGRAIRDTQRLPILVAGGGSRWFTHSELVLSFSDSDVNRSQDDHRAILAALLKRDAERAGALMTDHITAARSMLAASWDRPAPATRRSARGARARLPSTRG